MSRLILSLLLNFTFGFAVTAQEKSPVPGKVSILKKSPPVKEITNSIGMKLRLIPSGTFLMGSPANENKRHESEGPQHKVVITRPFYLGIYEVTQAQYLKVMGENPSYFNKQKVGRDTSTFPVDQVTWNDVESFCEKLSGLQAERRLGRVYRLPTEAEWEYACRGGAKKYQVFAFGDSLSSKQANFNGQKPYGGVKKAKYLKRTCKVGSYQPNGYGLYDMHGNVWEWCSDWCSERLCSGKKRTDPKGPERGFRRRLRGGSWDVPGYACRSAFRTGSPPSTLSSNFGFRVVLVVR
mgnify:CR=1 FL=1